MTKQTSGREKLYRGMQAAAAVESVLYLKEDLCNINKCKACVKWRRPVSGELVCYRAHPPADWVRRRDLVVRLLGPDLEVACEELMNFVDFCFGGPRERKT